MLDNEYTYNINKYHSIKLEADAANFKQNGAFLRLHCGIPWLDSAEISSRAHRKAAAWSMP
jgi:hypothetical protein